AAIAQQCHFQLGNFQFWIAPAESLLDHHLLGVMSPALGGRIGLSHLPRQWPVGMGATRQILHEMARPNLRHRYDLKPGDVIAFEILFELVRREPGIGWRDVVENLRRALLERPGRVHCGRGRRALEARSLLHFWQEFARIELSSRLGQYALILMELRI